MDVIESKGTSIASQAMKTKPVVMAKKGSSSKFLGKWRASSLRSEVLTISKVGTNFKISNKNQQWTKPPVLVYNSKTDRLEEWAEDKEVKMKMYIEHSYQDNNLVLSLLIMN